MGVRGQGEGEKRGPLNCSELLRLSVLALSKSGAGRGCTLVFNELFRYLYLNGS